ncbi:MAG TPA: ABC transporter permease subunit [Candidatus Binatia bacterium]|nr:ABC transporter permease subunit [Candidatus Binatia bacterium]
MRGYRELLEKEVVELWRTYRLGLFCVLFIVLGIASAVITRYLPELDRLLARPGEDLGLEPTGIPDVVDFLVRNLVDFGGIAAILLAMGAVAGERSRGTTALVLARPVSRSAYLLAKLVAIAMTVGFATVLGVLGAWLWSMLFFELPPVLPWAQMAVLVWLAVLVPASITFLGSTVFDSPLGAAGLGLGAQVLFVLASATPTPSPLLPTQLAAVARGAALEGFDPGVEPPVTIAVAAGIVAVSLGIAWLRFRRRDL